MKELKNIDDCCHVYRGRTQINKISGSYSPDRLAPQIMYQEKTVTTENDVIHVQRLLDEKEVSIVYNRDL